MSKRSRPRLLMLALLLVTGGAGWVTAVTLLWFGVDSMAVRYPIAVLGGYGAFLLCLRLWLRTLLRPEKERGDWDLDLTGVDSGSGGWSGGGGSAPRAPSFGGGSGGGGGAGGRWDVPSGGPAPMPSQPVVLPASSMPMDAPAPVRTLSSGGGGGGGGGGGKGLFSGLDLDSDNAGCLVIILIAVAVIAIVAAAGYAFAVAPVLLAELVVDGIVVGGLYTRVRKIDGDWLRAAIRRTWIPALVLAVVLGLVGYGIQNAMPGARSIGDVWRQPAGGATP